jgi:hypothetical protein
VTIVVTIIILLLIVCYIGFRSSKVQSFVSQKAANYLSKKLNTTITIKGVDFRPIKTLILEELYIEDQFGDTLLYTERFNLDISSYNVPNTTISFGLIGLQNATVHLKRFESDSLMNFAFLIDAFKSEKPTTAKTLWEVEIGRLNLKNTTFKYDNQLKDSIYDGIDYNHIAISDFNLAAKDIYFLKDSILGEIRFLNLKEKSGFELTNLKTVFDVDSKKAEFSELLIETPYSTIRNYYKMQYNNWSDYNDFINQVRLTANLEKTVFSSIDLSYFAPKYPAKKQVVNLSGEVKGKINRLRINNLDLETDKVSLTASCKLDGLPDFNETIMDISVDNLKATRSSLQNLINAYIKENKINLPPTLDQLGTVNFSGKYVGFYYDFVADGTFNTAIGRITSDLNLKLDGENTKYSGSLEGFNVDLKKITSNADLDRINFKTTVKGKGITLNKVDVELNGLIKSIRYKTYNYTNIDLNGMLSKKLFDGSINLNDKNVNLAFLGKIDLNEAEPKFSFSATLDSANLKNLNLYDEDLNISTSVTTNFYGSKLDNLMGDIVAKNTVLLRDGKRYEIEEVTINSKKVPTGKKLVVNSSIIEAELEGVFVFKNLYPSFKKLVNKYVPNLIFEQKEEVIPDQNFNFYINVIDPNFITNLLLPDLVISQNTVIGGSFKKDSIYTYAGADFIQYKEFEFSNLIVDQTSGEFFQTIVSSDKLTRNDSQLVENIIISSELANNNLNFNVKLAEKSASSQLDLNGFIDFTADTTYLSILESEIILDQESWKIKDQFNVALLENQVLINGFAMTNKMQSVKVNGIISKNPDDFLKVELANIELDIVNGYLKSSSVKLAGVLGGEVNVASVTAKPIFDGNINVKDFEYNGDTLGNVSLLSIYNAEKGIIDIDGNINNKLLESINIDGRILTKKIKNNLELDLTLIKTDLSIFQPLVGQFIDNLQGIASAELEIRGSTNQPEVYGSLTTEDVGLTVKYLNTRYYFSHSFLFDKDQINIDELTIKDQIKYEADKRGESVSGHMAYAAGIIYHNYLKLFELDMYLTGDNFMALNTTKEDNDLYYGTAIATADYRFQGPINNLNLDIRAETKKGTSFFIPATDASSIKQQEFIIFTSSLENTDENDSKKINLGGIDLNIDLIITPEAEFQIIFNEETGDIIKGQGEGSIKMVVNSFGDFEMYGEYVVTSGQYLFTLENLIRKPFTVRKGGTIRWTGDPYGAQIDIGAVYTIRVPLRELYYASRVPLGIDSTKRIRVETILMLEGELTSPSVTFDLNFPDDASLETKFASYLSVQDNVTLQAFSLLTFARFFSSAQGTAGSAIGSSAAELLVSQINAWANQFSDNISFNAAARSGLGTSISILDDRLSIDGNFSQYDNVTDNTTDLAGDITVEYKITEDGRFRIKAFNKTRDASNQIQQITNTYENIQGIGMFYGIDFDSLKEFMVLLFKAKQAEDTTEVE